MEIKDMVRTLAVEMKKEGVYPSCLYQYSTGSFVFADKNEKRITDIPTIEGIVLSVFNGFETDEYASSDIDFEKLMREARKLKNKIKSENFYMPVEELEKDFVSKCEQDPKDISVNEKLELVERIRDKILVKDQRIINVQCAYIESEGYKVFSDGFKTLSQKILRTRIFLLVQLMQNNIIRWN